MKKGLIIFGLLIAGAAIFAYLNRDALGYWVAGKVMTPATDFDQAAAPATPDYTDPAAWSALPNSEDGADIVPSSAGSTLVDAQQGAAVDVFFIHPTTYLSPDGWNAPLDDPDAKELIDNRVNVGQASVFNGCCAIYAPRYRQATFAAFFPDSATGEQSANGTAAMNLAYDDLERAFDYFLDNYSRGRPFVLAGHSQGAMHLKRLLTERINDTALLGRTVAVYAVGATYTNAELARDFANIPVCTAPDQIQCLVSWNTVGPRISQFRDTSQDVCVNPITWTQQAATHDQNDGALATATKSLMPAVADARCDAGQLWVSELRSEAFSNLPMNMGTDNYHILDFALFYANVRANAITRVNAFLDSASR